METAAAGNLDAVQQGVFAFTLSTELGTGWLTKDGIIPKIPLEVYNYIIDLGSTPERENDEVCRRIFREVGEFLAITCIESDAILHPATKTRILFGRLVKNSTCFKLMQEGAAGRAPEYTLLAADADMAHTPLMRRLQADPNYTVAQFAQAVGSIHFAV